MASLLRQAICVSLRAGLKISYARIFSCASLLRTNINGVPVQVQAAACTCTGRRFDNNQLWISSLVSPFPAVISQDSLTIRKCPRFG